MIPHRYPFLLIDRVVEMRAYRARRRHQERHNERVVLPGPLSADPIMPGVLLIESMAQTAAVLGGGRPWAGSSGAPVYFMSIDERALPATRATGRPAPDRDHGPAQQARACGSSAARPCATARLAAEAEFSAKIT